MLEYPADTFLTFFINHRLLQVNNRPQWKTVAGGSRHYVEKARKLIPYVHAGCAVEKVQRTAQGVMLQTATGPMHFDRVVMATHAPVTLKLLENPSEQERDVLGAIGIVPNRGELHRDARSMPKRSRCWSSWNVVAGVGGGVSLTYHLNRLQPLETKSSYFLSLNPSGEKREGLVQSFNYDHPRFTRAAIRAQRALLKIQGIGGVYYAGAWTRYGFHEDGLLSAVVVAGLMGVSTPWDVA
jgi:predicted NAD/FAD-binding protein